MYRTYLQEVKRVDILTSPPGAFRPAALRQPAADPAPGRASGAAAALLEGSRLPRHHLHRAAGQRSLSHRRGRSRRRLVFERVKGWWAKTAGEPRQIQFRPGRGGLLPGQRRRLRSLQGRRVRLLHRAPGEELAEQLSLPRGSARRCDPHGNPAPDPQPDPGVVHEHPSRRVQGRALRQALGEMFDFEWTNRALFSNSYLRSRSYPNSEFAASGVPEGQEWLYLSPYRKQLPAQLFKQPFSLPTTEGRGIPRETLRHALGLLADAGWKLSGDRLLNKGRTAALRNPAGQSEPGAYSPALSRKPRQHRHRRAPAHRRPRPIQAAPGPVRLRHDPHDPAADPQSRPGTVAVLPLQPGEGQGQQELRGNRQPGGRRHAQPPARRPQPRRTGRRRAGPDLALAVLQHSQLVPQFAPSGVPQPLRLRRHPAHTLGLRAWWQKNLETSR